MQSKQNIAISLTKFAAPRYRKTSTQDTIGYNSKNQYKGNK